MLARRRGSRIVGERTVVTVGDDHARWFYDRFCSSAERMINNGFAYLQIDFTKGIIEIFASSFFVYGGCLHKTREMRRSRELLDKWRNAFPTNLNMMASNMLLQAFF